MQVGGGVNRSGSLKIAVVGSGISGLAAAWRLSAVHDVTLYEKLPRLGGHSNTVDVRHGRLQTSVDTGFIVFNPLNYPNLTAMFEHLGVETAPSDMSFAVSLDGGALEYGGSDLGSLFAQRRNLMRPRFWSMLRDLKRFYTSAPADLRNGLSESVSLGTYLKNNSYGDAFTRDHLLPMAGAIWSASPDTLTEYPAAAFVRFFVNHGLLKLSGRPPWRTVCGGSRNYVRKLANACQATIRLSCGVDRIARTSDGVDVWAGGSCERYERVLIAAHADQALRMLSDASEAEQSLLSAFSYTRNVAHLHTDARLMPMRCGVWSSWNYIGSARGGEESICVTYWMNRLQPLATEQNLFVTLNAIMPPAPETLLATEVYEHPVFNRAAMAAQKELEALQGERQTWYCGAYFGSGFHEDGLRSGLNAAECMGAPPRPWAQTLAGRRRAETVSALQLSEAG